MTRSFAGAGTALVTPFTQTGDLDEAALRRLVRRQVEGGIDVLVPCGTTGEAATMTARRAEARGGHHPGGGGRQGARAGRRGQQRHPGRGREVQGHGRASAPTASSSVGPYYNKPTPEGFYRHFAAIADAVTGARRGLQRPGPHGQQHRHQDACCAWPRTRTSPR